MTRLSLIRNPFAASFRLLITVVAVIMLFTCCKRTKMCPAFSYGNYDAWFPYTEGQKLMFTNARQEKDSIVIFQNSRSAAEEVELGWWSSPKCRMESLIKGGEGGVYLEISCNLSESSKSIMASVDGFTVWGGSLEDTGLVLSPTFIEAAFKSTYHSSVHLNGKTYASVQLLERDTTRMSWEGTYRMYLSKENGIIAYEKYPSHDLWVKQ